MNEVNTNVINFSFILCKPVEDCFLLPPIIIVLPVVNQVFQIS